MQSSIRRSPVRTEANALMARPPFVASLVLLGAPRTKKTSNRVLRFGKRNKIIPSAPYLAWRDAVLLQLNLAWAGRDPIAFPVNVAAVFYRDAARGDLVGFMQGLADVLEEGRVVEDDKWITSWDGSRPEKDAARPRVELQISSASPARTEARKLPCPACGYAGAELATFDVAGPTGKRSTRPSA